MDNKFNIYAEYITGIFHGKDLITEKNFVYPSLYNNLKDLSGITLKMLYKNNQNISWGLGVTRLQASNWSFTDHIEYQGSEVKLQSISPIIQFHNKYSESKFFNRGKFFIEIAPAIGQSDLSLTNSPFTIQNSNEIIAPPKESSDLFFGIKGSAGLEWTFAQSTGMVISYSLQQSWIKSKLYNDSHILSSQLSIGIFLKLKKDKRFFY